ncbi:MAG: YegS/Rv2252/BmrU family lipid kinase, partial [Pyrinomonadaceae bacterium]
VIAAREAKAGRELIVACGGDGTINEVAGGILESGTDAELGILPSGTGGDFRRSLAIPARAADAARALRKSRVVQIDIGKVTCRGARSGVDESRFFINVASCGIAGEVVKHVKREPSRWIPAQRSSLLGGKATFALAALQATLSYKNVEIMIGLDEHRERALTVANLSVANARFIGGGMKIAPQAQLDDGLFEVIAVGDISSLAMMAHAPRLYRGTHLGLRQVSHARAASLAVRSANPSERIAIEVDGELAGLLPARFEIVPRALRVRVPV